MDKLLPLERSALSVAGWAALAALSFFFHGIAFMVCLILLVGKALEFKFLYENTNGMESEDIYGDDYSGQLCAMDPFPELGADWERSVRENLSENEGRWNKRVMG